MQRIAIEIRNSIRVNPRSRVNFLTFNSFFDTIHPEPLII